MWLLADSQLVSSLFIAGLVLLSASLLIRLSRRLSGRRGRQTSIADSRRLVEPSGGKRDALSDQLAQWDLEAALAEWQQLHAPPPDPRILPRGASLPAQADSSKQTPGAAENKSLRCEGPHGPPQEVASTHVSGCGTRGRATADSPLNDRASGDVQPASYSAAGRASDNDRSTSEAHFGRLAPRGGDHCSAAPAGSGAVSERVFHSVPRSGAGTLRQPKPPGHRPAEKSPADHKPRGRLITPPFSRPALLPRCRPRIPRKCGGPGPWPRSFPDGTGCRWRTTRSCFRWPRRYRPGTGR